ncbi:hypothetical protein DINO107042_06125 [Dichelobacter nodosus]
MQHLAGRVGVLMEHAAHGEIPGDAFHVLHITAEEAVFADGDAVGLGLVEAKEDADGVGLGAGAGTVRRPPGSGKGLFLGRHPRIRPDQVH